MPDWPAAADWRFVLPAMPTGVALCIGGSAERSALGPGCRVVRAAELPSRDDPAEFDLVAVLQPAPDWAATPAGLARLAGLVRSGGTVYVESSRRARWSPHRVARLLTAVGFDEPSSFWPRRGFEAADLWLPLGERRTYRFYRRQLYYPSSLTRRVGRIVLRALIAAGGFDLVVAEFATVAIRGGRHGARTA